MLGHAVSPVVAKMRLEYVLLHTLQEHKKLVEMFLQPSKEALIADELIRHSEFDMRVSAASCISQIIRITAPDEPYEEGHMKHEQKPEEEHVQRKRTRRPSSLIKAEEGYDPFWISINRKTLEKNPSKRSKKESFPAKTKIPKDLLPKDHSEKGQGSSIKVVPVEESRGKTSVSEGLNEDIMKSSLQCRPLHSKDKAPSGRVSKLNPKESLTHRRKRCASRVVGKDVVGRRIKIWWPLDKKFYRGKILCFDEKYKLHQIDYDDGEMEFLDLRRNVGNC